jgi:cytochrome c-type biogenesis protein
MTANLSLLLVFAAGLLSFLSPCVLPLIPSYFGILGGVGLEKEQSRTSARFTLFRAAAGFVLGFSIVFIVLGILVSTTFYLMGGISRYINWAAGIIVILLGLNILFDFLSFLNYEKRPFLQKITQPAAGLRGIPAGVPAAFLAGAAFGAGWTPCIGPVLTGILFMAGQSGKTGTAVFYLVVYCAGLALPFLLVALFFDTFLKQAFRFRSHMQLIKRISGIILIIIGIMILTGRYSALNILIQKWIYSYIYWAEGKAAPFKILADWLSWVQGF